MEHLKNQLDDYTNKVSGPINEIRAINIFTSFGWYSPHSQLNIVHKILNIKHNY